MNFLPRVLSFAIPLCSCISLALAVWGIYRARARLDRWAVLLTAVAFLAALAIRPDEHLLFFDEDIYIQIASNLTHAPQAQLTLDGGPTGIQASTYYKEPAGFPLLLSMIFKLTGTNETVAFILARCFFALTVGAVYMLGRAILPTTAHAATAAAIFAVTPAPFGYAASAGTDLPASLFATLGVFGLATGNGMLAAGAMAMSAQIRLEMIALVPLVFLSDRIALKWKLGLVGLTAAEVLHVAWVLSIAPVLARVEHVDKAFSTSHILKNLTADLRYVFNPTAFPTVAALAATVAVTRKMESRLILWVWLGVLSGVYLLFYAGSFELNPRYSIQITIPLVLLALSSVNRRLVLAVLLLTAGAGQAQPFNVHSYVQTLGSDHRKAVEFAAKLGQRDLVISGEPEVFLNHGKHAMNLIYASEKIERIHDQFAAFDRIFYYAGVRTTLEGSQEWEADRQVKSGFQLHPVDSQEILGMRIAIYELQRDY